MVVESEITAVGRGKGKEEFRINEHTCSNFFFSVRFGAGEDSRRDVVYTSILDGLPPSETGLLGNLLEVSSRDLVGPVSFKGFLDFPVFGVGSVSSRQQE